VNKGTKHVEQHALATCANYVENFHVHQSGEYDGLDVLNFCGVIDLAHRLVCFVGAVNKGESDVSGFQLKLSQDGLAKGLGCDSGAVGDEKNGSIWHW
jgi:hypothetical protein